MVGGAADIRNLSVMVIDDSQYTREILKTVLRGFGVGNLKEADNGHDGFRLLADGGDVDVIICDIEMKPINGIEFVRMLRQRQHPPEIGMSRVINPNTPVIMLTSHAKKSLVDMARQAGANAYIVKPVVPKVLFDRIERIAAAKR